MKLNIQALIAGVILALMLLTGCATPKNVVYFQDTKNDQIIDVANPLKITVQPEDKISIVVHSKDPLLANLFNLPLVTSRVGYTTSNTSQLSQQMSVYTVDANGMIDFPVLGKIKVEGKDRHEVADFVKNELIPTLPKLKMYVMGNTLLPYLQYPVIVKWSCIFVRLPTNNN